MTEKTATKSTTAKDTKAPKKIVAIKKRNTQETFTSKKGNKYIFMFTNTQKMQQGLDLSIRPDGIRSQLLLAQVLMESVLEGNEYDFDYFDKLIAEADKSDSVELEDEDGNSTTFEFKWPGIETVYGMLDGATDSFGKTVQSEYYDRLMKNVIVSPDLNWKYWDEHDGYSEVMEAVSTYVDNVLNGSEFVEVINAAFDFVERKFH